jgi:hypothetical protein
MTGTQGACAPCVHGLPCPALVCPALPLSCTVNTTVFIEFSRCAANAVETFALEPNLRQLLSRPRNW